MSKNESTVKTTVATRAGRAFLLLGTVLIVSMPTAARAQTAPQCGQEVKDYIVKVMDSVADASDEQKENTEAWLYQAFQYCGKEQAVPPSTFIAAARECGASVSNLGSLFYEEMSCCGYDPQRRQFACPVKIKQTFGFGGAPLPGSREHVLHCVANSNGILVPVGHDSVHLSDAFPGNVPTWQFAVIAAANENLQTVQPMNNQSRRARSILSWQFRPTSCDYTPIWGNALNYRIRLDQ